MKKASLLIFLLLLTLNFTDVFSQQKKLQIEEINKIHIENTDDEMLNLLKIEFEKAGIEIEDDFKNAEAKLLINATALVTLDGGKDDLPKEIYVCKLLDSENKAIWKRKISFLSKGDRKTNLKFAARKIVEKYIEYRTEFKTEKTKLSD